MVMNARALANRNRLVATKTLKRQIMDSEPYEPEPFNMDDDEELILSAYNDTGKRLRVEAEEPHVEAPSVRAPTTPVNQVGERKRPRFSADSPSTTESEESDEGSESEPDAESGDEDQPAPVPFKEMLAQRVQMKVTPVTENLVADATSYTDEPISFYGESGGRKGVQDLAGTSRKENADLRRKQASVVNVVLPGGYVGNVKVPNNIKEFTNGDDKYTPAYIIKLFTDKSGHSIASNRDHPHAFQNLGRGRVVPHTPIAVVDAWEQPGFELLACTMGVVQKMEKRYQEDVDFRRSVHSRIGTMRSEPSLQEIRNAILKLYMGGQILFSMVQTSAETGQVVPKFNVVYRMEPLWRLPATVLMNPTAEMKLSPAYDRVRKHYNIIASTYSLTNGCLAGQINRLVDTTRVKNEVMERSPNRFYSPDTTFKLIDELLGISPTLPKVDKLETWYRILTPGSSLGWSDEEDVDKLFTYEPTASAGLIWLNNQKRDQVILADIQYHQSVMEFVLGAEDSGDMVLFFKVLQEMMDRVKLVQIKPKYEITKIAKIRDKVRNIFVYPSCYQVGLGCFCQYFKRYLPKPMENGGSSLAGFTPMYGSLNIIIKTIMMKCENDGDHSGAFYSDNSYFMKRISENSYKWYSTDVEKMESTSTVEEGRMTMEYMMRVTGVPKSSALYQYLRYIGGDFSHDAVGVLGNMLIQVPGLSSGSQTTFLTNHIRMARAYSIMLPIISSTGVLDRLKDGEKVPFNYAQDEIFFNLELTTTSDFKPLPGSIYEGIRFVPLKMEYEDDECGTLTTFGGIVRLDTLGFDGTVVRLDPGEFPEDDPYTICACLDYERLMKAIAFRKTKQADQKDDKVGAVANFVNLIVEIMTMQTLYIVGGYAYPETHMLIRKIVHLIVGYVQEAVNRITTYSDEHNWSDEERRNQFTNMVLDHSEQFLGGSDSGNSRFISDDVKNQLAATVTKNVDSIFNRDFAAIEKFTTRESVITHFHTIRGKRIREAEMKKKLRALQAKHGGGRSKAGAILSAKNVDGEVAFHNIGI